MTEEHLQRILEKPMNFLALEALRAFVEGGSLAYVALRIHRTEPQVSRLLTSLQDAAGFPILIKEGRHLTITPEGRDYYGRVERLLEAADDLTGYSRQTRADRLRHVKVIAAPHIAEGILADALLEVTQANPGFTATIDARPSRDVDAVLGSGRFDVALTQLPIDHPRVDIRELGRSNAVVVMNKSNPLASYQTVTVEQLMRQPMIHLHKKSLIRQRFEAAFGSVQGVSHFEVSSGPMAAHLAAVGIGVALADPFAALSQIAAGAVIRKFEFDIPLLYGLAVPKARPTSPATDKLIAALDSAVQKRFEKISAMLNSAA